MRVSSRADGVSVGRTSNAGSPDAARRPPSDRRSSVDDERYPSPCATIEQRNAHVRIPGRTITFRCEVTTLRSLVRGRGGADMGRSPDRPYLRRPRVRPWLVGHWEMWQLRGPVVVAVVLVCGAAALLVGAQTVPLRAHRPRRPAHRRARAARDRAHRDRQQGRADAPARLRARRTTTSAPSGPSPPRCCSRRRSPRPSSSRVYLHLWVRVWRPAKSLLYRNVYTAAVVVLAAQAAHAVVTGSGGAAALDRRARPGSACSPLAVRGLRRGQQRPGHRGDRAAGRRPAPGRTRPGPPPARQGRRHRARDRHPVAGRADRRGRDAQRLARPARAGAAGGAAPRRHGPPARAAGGDGRQDRPAQRRGLARARPSGPCAAPSARAPRRACSSSTSTTSSRSTTPTATSPATRSCPPSPRRCGPRCARATSSAASAARSSSCCCATSS